SGLSIRKVERIPVHGGSLRLFAGNRGRAAQGASAGALLESEASWGVSRADVYRAFAERVSARRSKVSTLLGSIRRRGKRVAAYGACAKGAVLLNHFGIGR